MSNVRGVSALGRGRLPDAASDDRERREAAVGSLRPSTNSRSRRGARGW